MFDPPLFLANGLLCAAAFGFAAFVRPTSARLPAVVLAGLLAVNFVFCNLAYTPYAPKLALQAIGIRVSSKDLWMLADASYGAAAILIAFYQRWAWALWALAIVQVGLHAAYLAHMFDQYVYSDRLQNVLHAQLAVFFVIGGPGVGDHVFLTLDRLRNGRRFLAARTGRSARDGSE